MSGNQRLWLTSEPSDMAHCTDGASNSPPTTTTNTDTASAALDAVTTMAKAHNVNDMVERIKRMQQSRRGKRTARDRLYRKFVEDVKDGKEEAEEVGENGGGLGDGIEKPTTSGEEVLLEGITETAAPGTEPIPILIWSDFMEQVNGSSLESPSHQPNDPDNENREATTTTTTTGSTRRASLPTDGAPVSPQTEEQVTPSHLIYCPNLQQTEQTGTVPPLIDSTAAQELEQAQTEASTARPESPLTDCPTVLDMEEKIVTTPVGQRRRGAKGVRTQAVGGCEESVQKIPSTKLAESSTMQPGPLGGSVLRRSTRAQTKMQAQPDVSKSSSNQFAPSTPAQPINQSLRRSQAISTPSQSQEVQLRSMTRVPVPETPSAEDSGAQPLAALPGHSYTRTGLHHANCKVCYAERKAAGLVAYTSRPNPQVQTRRPVALKTRRRRQCITTFPYPDSSDWQSESMAHRSIKTNNPFLGSPSACLTSEMAGNMSSCGMGVRSRTDGGEFEIRGIYTTSTGGLSHTPRVNKRFHTETDYSPSGLMLEFLHSPASSRGSNSHATMAPELSATSGLDFLSSIAAGMRYNSISPSKMEVERSGRDVPDYWFPASKAWTGSVEFVESDVRESFRQRPTSCKYQPFNRGSNHRKSPTEDTIMDDTIMNDSITDDTIADDSTIDNSFSTSAEMDFISTDQRSDTFSEPSISPPHAKQTAWSGSSGWIGSFFMDSNGSTILAHPYPLTPHHTGNIPAGMWGSPVTPFTNGHNPPVHVESEDVHNFMGFPTPPGIHYETPTKQRTAQPHPRSASETSTMIFLQNNGILGGHSQRSTSQETISQTGTAEMTPSPTTIERLFSALQGNRGVKEFDPDETLSDDETKDGSPTPSIGNVFQSQSQSQSALGGIPGMGGLAEKGPCTCFLPRFEARRPRTHAGFGEYIGMRDTGDGDGSGIYENETHHSDSGPLAGRKAATSRNLPVKGYFTDELIRSFLPRGVEVAGILP